MQVDQAEKLRLLKRKSSVIKNTNTVSETKVLTITSGKGGVGKSSFAINLSLALQKQGKQVLLVDADIGMSNIDIMLGQRAKLSLADLINGSNTIEDIVVTTEVGIKFISGGSGIKKFVELNPATSENALIQIMNYAYSFDYVIFDTGAGMGENVLSFLLASQLVLVVTTPEPTAMADSYALIKTYNWRGGNAKINLVVNKVVDQKEAIQVYDKMQSIVNKFLHIDIDYLGFVLEDELVGKSIRKQIPLFSKYPNSTVAKSIANLTSRLLGQEPQRTSGNFKDFLVNLFGGKG